MTGRILLAVSSLLLASSAFAMRDKTPTPWSGVWEGTLGENRIVACFAESYSAGGDGAYYYRRHLEPIALDGDEAPGWLEGDRKSRWLLDAPDNDTVHGTWSPVGSAKSLPIRLSRVASGPDACASDRFNAPMEASFSLKVGNTESFKGAGAFRRLDYLGAESIEIDGSQAGIASINRQLRALLPWSEQDKNDRLETRRMEMSGINAGTFGGEASTKPAFWSPDFIQVFFHVETSGRGRAGISMSYRTWDLVSGREVDPWQWFTGASANEVSMMPVALVNRFNVADPQRPQDCEYYQGKDRWLLTLRADGIDFWEEPWGSGCELEFHATYAALDPFLTEAGKAAVARLRARPGVSSD